VDKNNLVEQFVNEFIEFKTLLEQHLECNDELLPHVFFGECNDFFIKSLGKEETETLEKLFDFFERMQLKAMTMLRNY
jgi:hypothetical protein